MATYKMVRMVHARRQYKRKQKRFGLLKVVKAILLVRDINNVNMEKFWDKKLWMKS